MRAGSYFAAGKCPRPWALPGGFVGVDVFVAISHFLIMLLSLWHLQS
jgi:peptidoglycan/LPS O-acetylase OafA/YrhL